MTHSQVRGRVSLSASYCIAGKFQGRKLLRIWRFCGYSRKFSFGVMASFGGTSEQSMKVFSAETPFPQICTSFFFAKRASIHEAQNIWIHCWFIPRYCTVHWSLSNTHIVPFYSVKQTVPKGMYKLYKPTTLSTYGVLFGLLVSVSV